jgi:uncharacterized membrane protein
MELPNLKQLKADAAHALRRGREPKAVILWYVGISTLLALAVSVLNLWLTHRISNTGGLGNMGTRSILSTVQAILPLAQSLVAGCLELGYLHAMLRICRGQYADQTDLKVGFSKILPLIRLTALQCLLCFAAAYFTYQASFSIFLLTPWADPMLELASSLPQGSILDASVMITEEFANQAASSMIPMLVIWVILLCLVMIPLSYRIRFAFYALLEEPRGRAFAALMTSFKMTRHNCWKLFRLDLSYWWYYALTILSALLCYADTLLKTFGIFLPMNETLAYFLFYGLYLAANFAIIYFFLNRVQATYTVAYDSLREKPANDGVVLGNIFDM